MHGFNPLSDAAQPSIFPRVLELRDKEYPQNIRPGEDITITIKGSVRSLHDDGTAILSIKEVGGSSHNTSGRRDSSPVQ